MGRAASIAFLAGVVGLAALLALRSGASRVRKPARETVGEPVVGLPGPGVDAPVELAPDSHRVAVATPEAAGLASPGEAEGWRVCVVDAGTNAAVAGATVSVLDVGALGEELFAHGIGFDTCEGLRLRRVRAVEATTGADGCARFSVPAEHTMVEARSGAAWAFRVVDRLPEERSVTLRLEPDRPLHVRVVDSSGTPVGGVPVALRRAIDARPAFTWKWTDTQAVGGLATFLHFQRRLAQGSGWHVLLAFPVRDQEAFPVDADTPVEPPVTLIVPDTGRVLVRVRNPAGRVPDLEGVDLALAAFTPGAGGEPLWPAGPWTRPHLDAAGEARVPWIGLGLELRAALVRDDAELVADSFAGPARPGEEVTFMLVLAWPSPATVTGRFVLGDGRAWPSATAEVQTELFPASERGMHSRTIAVHGDGRFRAMVRDARPANGTRALRFKARHPDDHGEVVAVVPLEQDVPPEGLDLGDVLLDYGELLVSGRVVDAGFRPIAGASVILRTHTVTAGGDFWPRIAVTGTLQTSADGAFALHLRPGEPPQGEELRLETRAEGFVAESERAVRRGERNVEVVLAQAGALAGSLELDQGLRTDDVTVFLSLAGARRQLGPVSSDETFEVRGLAPGAYALDVLRRGPTGSFERETAARIEDLLVPAGETCRDPRIQRLRIESVLSTLRIRVVDRASTPLKGAAVTIVAPPRARPTLSGDDGVCLVRCETLPVDLEVAAFGYVRQRLSNVGTDRDVVLEPGFPIRLRTSLQPWGKEPKYLVGVLLYAVDAAGVRRGPAWGP
jgi:hypothetical protein